MLHLAALAVLLLIPSVLGAACPVVAAQSALVGQSNLKASYLKPKFGQSKANIDSYTEKTIKNLIAGVDASLGQFKWENPWFFWPSANGWTSIAKYDHDRGTRKFYDAVSKSNDALAKSNQGCGSNKAALVNCFNDDAGWAGLASLEAYEAYGDQKFLDRAIGVWQVSPDVRIDTMGSVVTSCNLVSHGPRAGHAEGHQRRISQRDQEPRCQSTSDL
jgi:hypothetical protein